MPKSWHYDTRHVLRKCWRECSFPVKSKAHLESEERTWEEVRIRVGRITSLAYSSVTIKIKNKKNTPTWDHLSNRCTHQHVEPEVSSTPPECLWPTIQMMINESNGTIVKPAHFSSSLGDCFRVQECGNSFSQSWHEIFLGEVWET